MAEDFKPVAYHLGQSPVPDGLSPYSDDGEITLSSTDSLLTVDYGAEVAGFPYIEVLGFDGSIQVEFKYSEAWNGLQAPLGDGPFPFAVSLANTYRIETFIIDKPGSRKSRPTPQAGKPQTTLPVRSVTPGVWWRCLGGDYQQQTSVRGNGA